MTIKVFQKKKLTIQKECHISTLKEDNKTFTLKAITFDKKIKYTLMHWTSNQSKEEFISCINLDSGTIVDKVKGDITDLLGMFFLSDNSNIFILMFKTKFVWFLIQRCEDVWTKRKVETMSHYSIINTEHNWVINSFKYNHKHRILCLFTNNYCVFYNLSNPKFYNISYHVQIEWYNHLNVTGKETKGNSRNSIEWKSNKIVNNNKDKEGRRPGIVTSWINFFGRNDGVNKENTEQKDWSNHSINAIESNDIYYKKTQFFFEILYNKLYLIILNFETQAIQLYSVQSLNNIFLKYDIPFKSTYSMTTTNLLNYGTLQFVDNLILFHNYNSRVTSIFDLKIKNAKNEKLLYTTTPITDYKTYQKEPSKYPVLLKENMNNHGFYQPNSYIIHNNFYKIDNNKNMIYYLISFNADIYYKYHAIDYECVFNWIRHKHCAETIILAMYNIIIQGSKTKVIKIIFSQIVRQIHKLSKKKYRRSQAFPFLYTNASSSNENQMQSFDIPKPLTLTNKRKKTMYIKQIDIYNSLYPWFEGNKDMNFSYWIILWIFFSQELLNSRMQIHPSFNALLSNWVKRNLSRINEILILFQYHSIPDSIELAIILIESNDDGLFQIGVDMLFRWRKIEDLFLLLLKKNKFKEAMTLLSQSNPTQCQEWLKILKEYIAINKWSESNVKILTMLVINLLN